jgi:hypothetical protein
MILITLKTPNRILLLTIAATLAISFGQWIPYGSSSHTNSGGSRDAISSAKATSLDEPAKSRKVKLKGIIVGRATDEVIVRTVDGLDRTIRLAKETKLVERKRNPFRSGKQYSQIDLLRGLNVEVEAYKSGSGPLVATSIKFSEADIKLARTVNLLLNDAAVDKSSFDLKLNLFEQSAQRFSAQLDELASVPNSAKGEAKAAQETADTAVAEVRVVRDETQTLINNARSEGVRERVQLAQQIQTLRTELDRVRSDAKPQGNRTPASNDGGNPSATPSPTPNAVGANDFQEQLDAVIGILDRLVPGKILHNIPPTMEISVPRTIDISIVKEVTKEIRSRFGENTTVEPIKIGPVMAVSLVSSDGAFEIKRQFPLTETQVVGNDEAKWVFAVTPSQPGDHVLEVFATVQIDIPGQGKQVKNIPVFHGPIKVNVGFFYYPWSFIKANWDKIAGLLVSSGIAGLVIGWIVSKRKKRRNDDDVHEID